MERYTAIILAAGSGKRMKSTVHKQYLQLSGKPVLYYAVKAFEESDVTNMVLVVGKDETQFCQETIIEKYHIKKNVKIVEGGKERYHSVFEGLKAAEGAEYVLIHDGARPLIDQEMIKRTIEAVKKYQACVVGVPVKDTIKVVDQDGYSKNTPNRNTLWQMQTPQAFAYQPIYAAYEKAVQQKDITVTDDAMVLEKITGQKTKIILGDYRNIKITTPEDLLIAEAYLNDADGGIK